MFNTNIQILYNRHIDKFYKFQEINSYFYEYVIMYVCRNSTLRCNADSFIQHYDSKNKNKDNRHL